MKIIQDTVAKPLAIIINQTLKSGIFPDKLKIAKVTPIYKKDNEQLVTNYRPMSISGFIPGGGTVNQLVY